MKEELKEALAFFSELVTEGGSIDTKEKLVMMRRIWNELADREDRIRRLEGAIRSLLITPDSSGKGLNDETIQAIEEQVLGEKKNIAQAIVDGLRKNEIEIINIGSKPVWPGGQ